MGRDVIYSGGYREETELHWRRSKENTEAMTLLDAPRYDSARARRIRNIKIAVFMAVVLGAFGTWWFWNWPEEHRVNTFLATVESGDQSKAYGIWNNDPDWQQHPERYRTYGFDRFQQDWGTGGPNGQIRSYRTVLSRTWGNGVLMGVDINGGKKPIFLWVDRKTKQISFSPVELYRPIWDTKWDSAP